MNSYKIKNSIINLDEFEIASRVGSDLHIKVKSSPSLISAHYYSQQEAQSDLEELNKKIEESKNRPKIICLCGSRDFEKEFKEQNCRFTMEGRIVVSIGCFNKEIEGEDKINLDELHKRKIDLADEVFVINKGQKIGISTTNEIKYAKEHNKIIKYLEPFK